MKKKTQHDISEELSKLIRDFNNQIRSDTRFTSEYGGIWNQPVVLHLDEYKTPVKKRKNKINLP
jgi:hypothetical protein